MAETHIVAAEGCCLTPQSLRLLNRAIACQEGVSFDMAYEVPPLFVSPEGAGMNVVVNPGSAFIEGDVFTGEGMYFVSNDAQVSLTVPAADPADPRCDIVVAQVDGAAEGQCWELSIVSGVPAPQPACPAIPDSAIQLAQILVPAAATSIESGDITDTRESYGTCTGEGVFRSYNPQFNTTGVEEIYGRWMQVGDLVIVRVRAHVTNMPTAFTCTVPVPGSVEAGWLIPMGTAVARRDAASGANVFTGQVINNGSGSIETVTVVGSDTAPGGQWGPGSPTEWQDGVGIGLRFGYEAA